MRMFVVIDVLRNDLFPYDVSYGLFVVRPFLPAVCVTFLYLCTIYRLSSFVLQF